MIINSNHYIASNWINVTWQLYSYHLIHHWFWLNIPISCTTNVRFWTLQDVIRSISNHLIRTLEWRAPGWLFKNFTQVNRLMFSEGIQKYFLNILALILPKSTFVFQIEFNRACFCFTISIFSYCYIKLDFISF